MNEGKTRIERPRRVIAVVESSAPYSASRPHGEPKNADETPEEYDARTWRHKLTLDHSSKRVVIPGMGFKLGLDFAAGVKNQKVTGRGSATFKKLFVTGVIVESDAPLGIDPNDDETVKCDRLFVNLDGVRGSGKRGFRYFPRINSWKTEVSFAILNPDISTQVFLEHLSFAGLVAGVGRFRPEKGGSNGRFVVRDYREEALA
jgi:hypothetical protein